MIKLESLSLQKGHKQLLDGADLTLHAGWRVGLIGENGSGKTSFFGLLKKPSLADDGVCSLPKHWVISHLEQEVSDTQRKALDYVIDGHQAYRTLEKQIEQAQLEQAKQDNAVQLAKLLAEFEAIGAYQIKSQAATLLSGLGFSEAQQQQNLSSFSGGWRIRLNLAKALMCPSDLLLLDEPTNHLDLDSILWLENWLKQYQGTLIIVSHDREFLDQSVQYVVHFNNKKLDLYKGNYSQFEIQKSNNEVLQQAQYEKQQKQIAHMEDFVRRFKAKATKAKQAQSRVKALEKIERILPAHSKSPFSFQFFNHDALPNCLVRLEKSDMGYGQTCILKSVELEITPETRLGILGLNGSGKSTLLKSLMGEQALLAGERFINEKTKLGYFSQHQLEALDLTSDAMTHVLRLSQSRGEQVSEQQMRNFLGSFGFIGDRVFEGIAHFSGGEKSRLALALICWTKPNLLILDEPTNHLDMEMRHALTLALQNFNGALVLVSHDRHLIRCTTDELYLINNGRCESFDGDIDNYSSFLDKDSVVENKTLEVDETLSKKDKKRLEAEQRAKVSPLKKELATIEKQLEKLTAENADIEASLADSTLYEDMNKEKLKQLLLKQKMVSSDLIAYEERWLDISDQIESLLSEE